MRLSGLVWILDNDSVFFLSKKRRRALAASQDYVQGRWWFNVLYVVVADHIHTILTLFDNLVGYKFPVFLFSCF